MTILKYKYKKIFKKLNAKIFRQFAKDKNLAGE